VLQVLIICMSFTSKMRLRKAIQNHRRGKLSRGIVLIHDIARPHTARLTQTLLRDEFHWDPFDHPPYSPDLAPSDFHLFLKMKEHLAGQRHADDEDLRHEEGISKLVSRYDKCLNVQGDYVE
jgi:transposase